MFPKDSPPYQHIEKENFTLHQLPGSLIKYSLNRSLTIPIFYILQHFPSFPKVLNSKISFFGFLQERPPIQQFPYREISPQPRGWSFPDGQPVKRKKAEFVFMKDVSISYHSNINQYFC